MLISRIKLNILNLFILINKKLLFSKINLLFFNKFSAKESIFFDTAKYFPKKNKTLTKFNVGAGWVERDYFPLTNATLSKKNTCFLGAPRKQVWEKFLTFS